MDTLPGAEGNAKMRATTRSDRAFRVVLADDHEDVLHEIRALLDPEFDILRSVTDGLALIEAVRESKPDVVISDVQMPGLSGIEACRRIVQNGSCSAAIILTIYNDFQLVKNALQAGIRGFVLKVDAGEELASAVHAVLDGSVYLSHGVRRKWME
jgi:DNA-binding NarL/FixJ family response regulator